MLCPAFCKASATSILFTEPNNLSPVPTLDAIFTSKLDNASDIVFASSINFCSLKARCFKFSAKTFLADTVAKIACP